MPEPTKNGRFVERGQNGRFDAPSKARTEKAREVADDVRKKRGTFDREKFDKFIDTNPLLSNLHLLSGSDD